MKFLQKMVYGLAALAMMAATPNDSNREAAPMAAAQVTCKGVVWTDGELLGYDNGKAVYTYLLENRIYIRREPDGIMENTAIILHLTNSKISNTSEWHDVLDNCVNAKDPSTINNGYLQPKVGDAIPCNGKLITDKLFLGTYIGGDRVKTFQYARIIDDKLRINFQREGTDATYNSLSMGLIQQTIAGENGSTMAFNISGDEVRSCFWDRLPITATPVNTCASGPTLQTVSNVTATSLQFSFTGSNIPNVKWRIKSGSTQVASGTTAQLSGATSANITYASLGSGTYTLEIEGGDCSSAVSSKTFTVALSACNGGPTITAIKNIGSTSLTVDFNGTNIPNLSWAIKSGSTTLASGKTGNLTSNSANITYSNIVNGTYTLEIQGGDCSSSVSSQSFNIAAACARGPILQEVSSITPQGLSFLFDGEGIYGIGWKIKQGSTTLRESTVTPTSNRPAITFTTLPTGIYTLEIQGSSCVSTVSSMSFTVGTPANACASGPTLQSISNITQTSLQFTFAGTSIPNVKWWIKSGSTELRSGTTGQLSGATTVNISFTSLSIASYTLEIEGGDCSSSVSSQTFNVPMPACNGGPTISSITNISSTGLTVNFAGTNIPNLSWAIKSGSTTLASGKTGTLTGNAATLSYSNIVNGTYTLEIQGGDCSSSVSSQNFTILANCDRGPVLQDVSSITEQSLNFLFDGNGVYGIGWKIKQGSTMLRESTVAPQSNRPSISFNTIPAGTYTLEIQGSTCVSAVSARSFSVGTPLPIYIANFEAKAVKAGIDLSWKVVSEKNGDGFEILRLNNDLKKSDVIGKVPLTEQRVGDYHFLDENPVSGNNYYQLKQIDNDGTYIMSKIISAKFEQIYQAFAAPNPASDYIDIQFDSRASGTSGVEIYNMAGIKLSSTQIKVQEGKNVHRINTGKLSSGGYFVKVLAADQGTNLRFVKVD